MCLAITSCSSWEFLLKKGQNYMSRGRLFIMMKRLSESSSNKSELTLSLLKTDLHVLFCILWNQPCLLFLLWAYINIICQEVWNISFNKDKIALFLSRNQWFVDIEVHFFYWVKRKYKIPKFFIPRIHYGKRRSRIFLRPLWYVNPFSDTLSLYYYSGDRGSTSSP